MTRTEPTVCVVGGGITGLSAAWELATAPGPRPHVVLLESDLRLGGKLRTTELGHRSVDLGPDAFLARRDEALKLCRELGLGPDLVSPGANRSYVWVRGRLRPLPLGLTLGIPTRFVPLARSGICSPAGLGRALLDLVAPSVMRHRASRPREDDLDDSEGAHGAAMPTDESVGSVIRRRLGNEIHDRLADPLIGGIHAGGIDTTSAAAVFPQLLEADARPGSLMRALRSEPRGDAPVFMTLRGGLGRLTQRLTAALAERAVDILPGATARSLDLNSSDSSPRWSIAVDGGRVECDGVVVCVPAPEASRLIRRVDGSLAALLEGIPYASVTLVTVRMARSAVAAPLDGTGFLVPAKERRLITACTWLSSKWPLLENEDDVLLRASMGRYGDERAGQMSDDELLARTLEELGQMIGLSGEPLEAVVTRWPAAFPQYLVGHRRRVQQMEAAAAGHVGLALAGAALHGIGIPACIGSGRGGAERVLGALSTTPWVTG